ncbi:MULTISPECIES: precorrin-8X methylmutase [unclassified Pseudovibrio]|uniref:precorrin-8X methylmutase n=1 Tax=unclassified Pseudovibrio TaxID=2627060 RepID=UPI0007AECCAD|nr:MULTISPECIES: precorrin-8X methylmutase [unclassified Pseudovibrio]KZL00235.1 Precorrin-8X methylmutase [Pseudovibrio sp. W74]KZL11633.1 Precorrin-8X methylmutase [Pseudovibrio sp. Ad14]
MGQNVNPEVLAPYDYIKDPAEIYRQSFSIVRTEADLKCLPDNLRPVAVRLIHSCGMTDIPQDLAYSEDVVAKANEALRNGAPVLTDVEMVAHGIIRKYLPADNQVICTLNQPDVPELTKQLGTTRSAAAVEHWRPHLEGAVIAIGNAPTALFHLLEIVANGAPKPAAILGFPVGFVGAAESKQALATSSLGIPFLTLQGRRGGSAIAAAAVNAMAAGLPEEKVQETSK